MLRGAWQGTAKFGVTVMIGAVLWGAAPAAAIVDVPPEDARIDQPVPGDEDPGIGDAQATQAEQDALARAADPARNPSKAPMPVSGAQDAYSQMYANPDGTFLVETSAAPRWGKDRAGEWKPLVTTLEPRSGRLFPKTPAVPLSFSMGGVDAPLVTIGTDQGSVSMSVTGELREKMRDSMATVKPSVDSDSVCTQEVLRRGPETHGCP